jgi:hypothetical protein
MVKGFSCWVIVTGATPTAFRARHPEDLLPTLRQLQRTQPDTTMKWFERGRFWNSPEEAADAQRARRQAAAGRDRRWRPGGDHVDPRAKYQISRDEKRARFKRNQLRGRLGENRPPDDRAGDTPKVPSGNSFRRDRPPDHRGRKPGPPNWSRPGGQDRPQSNWRPKPKDGRAPDRRAPEGSSSHKSGPSSPRWSRPGGQSRPGGGSRPRGSWGSKEGRPPGNRPQGNWGSRERRPPGHRPPGGPFRPRRDGRGKKPK